MITTFQAARIFRQQSRPVEHVGLAYAKLVPSAKGGDEASKLVREQLATARLPAVYPPAFRRWRALTAPLPVGRVVLRFRAESPVLCGLGEPTPLENGLSLHHTYGTPLLPGSSLKGVTRAWMTTRFADDEDWGTDSPGFRSLFGVGGHGGEGAAVDFLDGWLEPTEHPWSAEILTPHYASYYSGEEGRAPDGRDNPVPVTYLAVAAGTHFRVVLEGDNDWLPIAGEALTRALEESGIGAKTRAGYGRMTGQAMSPEDQEALQALEEARLPSAGPAEQLAILSSGRSEAEVELNLKIWLGGGSPQDERFKFLVDNAETRRAITDWLRGAGALDRWKKGSRTEKELRRSLLDLAAPPDPQPATDIPEFSVETGSRFGDKVLSPADLAPLPGNKKKHSKERQRRIQKIAAGGYSEAAVEAFLVFLEENKAPSGALNQVRRAYGLPEVT
jgi:CRISPR-associated protein Cmr6